MKENRKKIRKKISQFIALFIIFILFAPTVVVGKENTGLQVHYIDVGQGDSTLITCDGHAMLIDAGTNDKGTLVQNYLNKQGITSFDYIIGTHPDADHIGGLDVILYKFPTQVVWMPEYEKKSKTYEDVENCIFNRNITREQPKVGEKYPLGGAVVTILAPTKKYDDANNNSIAVKVTYKNNSFLFCGDAERELEQELLKNRKQLKATVYKVSHHGSASASSKEFLDAVKPQYAIISVGKENSYGHPSDEALKRLEGCNVYRTDEQGTIIATSDGEQVQFNTAPTQKGKDTSVLHKISTQIGKIIKKLLKKMR